MSNNTVLYNLHCELGAKLVEFAGWTMPLHYGSQLQEHLHVRASAGLFDVSHMAVIDIQGEQAQDFLRYLLANDVAKLTTPGQALYSCLLNERGGIIDDLLCYWLDTQSYRVVVNAGTANSDLEWLQQHQQSYHVDLVPRHDLAILAVQGPEARSLVAPSLPKWLQPSLAKLPRFHSVQQQEWFVARTGYTGEDGYEIILPCDEAVSLAHKFIQAGIKPCGLGARDTLRLEAGLNLYGSDMTQDTTPYEANLAWTVARQDPERHFIGRKALEEQLAHGHYPQLRGLVLQERGVLRNAQEVRLGEGDTGIITSGSYAPSLQQSIALARVPPTTESTCEVFIRHKWCQAIFVQTPFIKAG